VKIDFAKACFGKEEVKAVNRVMRGIWLASGKENEMFEKEFAKYIGVKYAVCVNSGSSANLLALASLNLPKGSKVLTSACGFPATLSPIIHLGLKPVLVDYDVNTCNIDVGKVFDSIQGVKAIIFAHTLGNPVEMEYLIQYCREEGIHVIEDCCEAVGASYQGKKVGSHGTLGTYSFYPAHQMTALGGGGMVVTDNEELYKRMKSLRDWGKMYDWDSDKGGNDTDFSSPIKYHRGYTYETIGWNMKLPEANAAFGRVQLKRLDLFNVYRFIIHKDVRSRVKNKNIFIKQIDTLDSAPFGICLLTKHRNKLSKYLSKHGIKNRPFFAGNILRHEPFKHLDTASKFPGADWLMNRALFIGCWPSMTTKQVNYMIKVLNAYS